MHDKAVDAVRSALEQITTTRGTYIAALRAAETAMTAQGYEPEVIDNVDGTPAGTPTQRASAANEKQLREARARTQADLDRMQRQLGTMLATDHTWNKDTLDKLADQISAAKDRLAQFDSVDQALANAPETYLAQLDIPADYHGKVHAAVAVGNPDTARNVSVTVPGVGSTTRASLPDMVKEARSLRDQATQQLVNAGKPGSVSTIAWMGYDPPPNPINTGSVADGLATMGDGQARAGAASLSSYLEQVHVNNPNAHLTLLGHSYGSLTSSLALQQLNAEGLHPVNDVVFYGSPGLELTDPAQLGVGAGHAYVMGAPTDPIVKWIAPLSDSHGWGANPYDGMLPQLSAQAGPDPTGVYHPGVNSHADYPRLFHTPDGRDLVRMSEYNLAAIAAGLPDNKVLATPQLPPPGPPVLPPNLFPPNIPPRIVEGGG
nr:alpha/beta hydrolase [Mycobacterium kyorinense]